MRRLITLLLLLAAAATEIGLPAREPAVAQVGNLLYRRLAVGWRWDRLKDCGLPIRDTADCQSALRFIGAMRVRKSGLPLLGGVSRGEGERSGLPKNSRLEPAGQPTPRMDANSQLAHTQLLEKARKGGIDIYFEGDSITRRWGTSDPQYKENLANWTANFFGWNAADFGWGADLTQNILWRLENGELDGINPKIIVILAGSNNVGAAVPDDAKIADITRGLKAILDVCREKAPAPQLPAKR